MEGARFERAAHAYTSGNPSAVPAMAGAKRGPQGAAMERARQAEALRRARGSDHPGQQSQQSQEREEWGGGEDDEVCLLDDEEGQGREPNGTNKENNINAAGGADKVPKLAWITISVPEEGRDKINAQEVMDQLTEHLVDWSDDQRDGGVIEGMPEKFNGKTTL